MKTRFGIRALGVAFLIAVFSVAPRPAAGQPAGSSETTTRPAAEESASTANKPMALQSLIQELPDYTGDLRSRKYLTGDWGGERTKLAEQGILFDLGATQWLQGNARGGKDTHNAFRYSGSADYTLRFDTARMGLWPGGLITLRGETQFGQSINSKVGALGAPNYQALLPVPGDSGETTLSEFFLTQALSEKFVVVAGKMDLTTGDGNEFAHDQRAQFSNLAFRVNPVLFPAGPYTAMTAGVILIPTKWLTINTFVNDNDPDGAATTTGFNTAFHDRTWISVAQEYDFTLKLFGRPGHQRFGWFYTTKDFIDFESDPRLQLPGRIGRLPLASRTLTPKWLRKIQLGNTIYNIRHPEKRPDDWGLYYNFDQYVYTKPDDPSQGVGFFGRFGWSTGESNPIEQFYSLGVGGKGMVPHRPRDQWGVGYYLMNMSDDLQSLLPSLQSEQGIEAYYNFEIMPWLHISPDLQVIVDPGAGFGNRDVSLVYGLRVQMTF
ncbi:MAG: carbohydrate porin [Planctomycetes bacterium]|nr:carbohydrate porin [Planctomycetota bacterium]